MREDEIQRWRDSVAISKEAGKTTGFIHTISRFLANIDSLEKEIRHLRRDLDEALEP